MDQTTRETVTRWWVQNIVPGTNDWHPDPAKYISGHPRCFADRDTARRVMDRMSRDRPGVRRRVLRVDYETATTAKVTDINLRPDTGEALGE